MNILFDHPSPPQPTPVKAEKFKKRVPVTPEEIAEAELLEKAEGASMAGESAKLADGKLNKKQAASEARWERYHSMMADDQAMWETV